MPSATGRRRGEIYNGPIEEPVSIEFKFVNFLIALPSIVGLLGCIIPLRSFPTSVFNQKRKSCQLRFDISDRNAKILNENRVLKSII